MTGNRTTLLRKIIPFIAIAGSWGGLSTAAMQMAGSEDTFFKTGVTLLLYILAGTIAGFAAVLIFERRGRDIISRNVKGNIYIIKQPVYFLTAAAMMVAFITNMKPAGATGMTAAVFFGFAFFLGLSNGLFDYRESVSRNILYLGAVPIGLGFVYGYYINGGDQAINMVWLYGSAYLFSYLLFVNRMKLNSIIFFRKSVNIEDSKKIRMFNDWLIILLYMFYLVLFNFRKLLNVSYDIILRIINWSLAVMSAIMEWLLAEGDSLEREDLSEKEKLDEAVYPENPLLEKILKIIMYTLFAALAVAIVVVLVATIIKIIKKIAEKLRSNYNRSMSEKKVESKEYVEESEIIKDTANKDSLRRRKKKFRYSLKKLGDIPLAGDKVRYVYGFVLERLYHRQVAIEPSDTPEEIIGKIRRIRNGGSLNQMGFEEFTEKYRKARYSGKDIEPDENLLDKAEKFEKAISGLQTDSDK
ncbi:MAG: hypothetical protein JXB33_00185 [Clostridia bacterium]|nr:hypothetical protein [Clostridia bacterium]